MEKIKLYDELENDSDEEYDNRGIYTSNYCNCLIVLLSMSLVMYFIIISIYYYFQLDYYQPYNIKIYNRNPYHLTWNTNKLANCNIQYSYNANSFINNSTNFYKNKIYNYKSYITNVNYYYVYNFRVKCEFNKQSYNSQYFQSLLYP